jgi:hypothetical protein
MSPSEDAEDVHALREILLDLARLPDANRYLAGLMSGLDLRYELGDPDPLVGRRMVDLSLETAGGPTTVSHLLRNGHGLLLDLRPDAPVVDGLGPHLDHVVARVVDSPVGTTLDTRPGVDRVLVRPDGYVCWTGRSPNDAPTATVRRWFHAGVHAAA